MSKYYVTVSSGMSGWFSVMMEYDADCGVYFPFDTGLRRFSDIEGAIADAREWARAEGLEYRD